MSVFRSEPMSAVSIYMADSVAPQLITELIEFKDVEFMNISNANLKVDKNLVDEYACIESCITKFKFLAKKFEEFNPEEFTKQDIYSDAARETSLEAVHLSSNIKDEMEIAMTKFIEKENSFIKVKAEYHRCLQLMSFTEALDKMWPLLPNKVLKDRDNKEVLKVAEEGKPMDDEDQSRLLRKEGGDRKAKDNEDQMSLLERDVFVKKYFGIIPSSQKDVFHYYLYRALRGNFVGHYQEMVVDPVWKNVLGDEYKEWQAFCVMTGSEQAYKHVKIQTDSLKGKMIDVNEMGLVYNEDVINMCLQQMVRAEPRYIRADYVPRDEIFKNLSKWFKGDPLLRQEDIKDHLDDLFITWGKTRDDLKSTAGSYLMVNQPGLNLPDCSLFMKWKWIIAKNSEIANVMKKFIPAGGGVWHGRAWVPTSKVDLLTHSMTFMSLNKDSTEFSDSQVQVQEIPNWETTTKWVPPTYLPTTPFTNAYQELANSYGAPRYREVNPAFFYLATFPFLFGLMFGDFIHGLIMLVVGGYLIWNQQDILRKRKSEMISMFVGGRYLILMMGAFSMYVGCLFNEYGSLPVSLFGASGWNTQSVPAIFRFAYPFGIDTTWRLAKNELLFVNSVKMKLSVLLGIIHMSCGIVLSSFNAIEPYAHLRKEAYPIDILLFTVPRLLLLLSLFGYLGFLIVYKWLVDWNAPGAGSPPSLLSAMILMFLSPGKVAASDQLYAGQAIVQTILVLLAVVCIPWMLLGKPIHRLYRKKQDERRAALHDVASVLDGADDAAVDVLSLSSDSHLSQDSLLDRNQWTKVGKEETAERQRLIEEERQRLEKEKEREKERLKKEGYVEFKEDESKEDKEDKVEKDKDEKDKKPDSPEHAEDEHTFGHIMMHSVIESIEFVLGTISNTASYLRLWALSLAHGQLSRVLWEMVWENLVKVPVAGPFLAFAVWFVLTVCILLLMEGLSAFLHALRLHWVEFNNKFFIGTNSRMFQPSKIDVAFLEVGSGAS